MEHLPLSKSSSLVKSSIIYFHLLKSHSYYDLTGRDICVKQEHPNWSKNINSGVTACGQLPLADPLLNNNRIVGTSM